jgi:hypothetical protein
MYVLRSKDTGCNSQFKHYKDNYSQNLSMIRRDCMICRMTHTLVFCIKSLKLNEHLSNKKKGMLLLEKHYIKLPQKQDAQLISIKF